jgi:hypothetical protein
MSQVDNQPPAQGARPGWLDWMVRERQSAAYVLFGLSVLFWVGCVVLALLPRWLEHEDRFENFWPAAWAASLGLVTLGAGLWELFYEPEVTNRHDAARVVAIGVGGLAGLLTTVLGVVLAWQWWGDLTSWLKADETGTGLNHVVFALAAFFGGLAIMFLSLQLARTRERASATLRRLLYGYNAVLMGVLLAAVLLVANVMVSAAAPKVMDFTSSGMYSLSSRSKSVLEEIKKPTHIYVIMNRGTLDFNEVMTLLDNCRAVNDRIDVVPVSPDSARAEELARQYPDAGLARGSLLIVYGDEKDAPHSLINSRDLFSEGDTDRTDPDAKRSLKFKGEEALITQLDFLVSGKHKAVVYFTQGNGELDLNNSQADRQVAGMGLFRERLEKRNFDVKPLTFTPNDAKVPDDAALVVVARPLYQWPDNALKALDKYMNPPDRKKQRGLLVLFDLNVTREGKVQRSGLEEFVGRFNVHVTDQRVLSVSKTPSNVFVIGNPLVARDNPVASAYSEEPLVMNGARVVEPGENRAPGSSYDAQSLFIAIALGAPIWTETDLTTPPTELLRQLGGNRDLQMRKFTRQAPVAVAVTERAPNPHAFMGGQPPEDLEPKPRLVVFGSAHLVTNYYMAGDRGQGDVFGAVTSCMEWLRQRPAGIGIEPKRRDVFTFSPGTDTVRMSVLPALLMLFGVVGLGAGVWLVRRR